MTILNKYYSDNDAGYIYVLQCNNEIIYVGFTSDIYRRLAQHFGGRYKNGLPPTIFRENKPLNVIKVYRGLFSDENKFTYCYMAKYGINKVYGGDFASIYRNLYDSQIKEISLKFKDFTSAPESCTEIDSNHFNLWIKKLKENTKDGTCKLTMKKLLANFLE